MKCSKCGKEVDRLFSDPTRGYQSACFNCKWELVNPLICPQPAPLDSNAPMLWELVIEDMRSRDDFGRDKYGKRLRAKNGRDALVDAYQEALDQAVYLRQMIWERDNP